MLMKTAVVDDMQSEALRFLISFYLLPVRKPLIYRGFRLSLDFLYALFTPFFCNWRRSLLKLAYGIYQ